MPSAENRRLLTGNAVHVPNHLLRRMPAGDYVCTARTCALHLEQM